MSRIGRTPIPVPSGVEVKIDDHTVTVKGPRGELSRTIHRDMSVTLQDGVMLVERPSDAGSHRALHGLTRTLLANMVVGVTQGFKKFLEINGVGYKAAKQANKLSLQLGFSHPVEIIPPPGIEVTDLETFTPTMANQWLSARFAIMGSNREHVGELAAKIRALRTAEPYKGKGIRYKGEVVRRKAGKAGKGRK